MSRLSVVNYLGKQQRPILTILVQHIGIENLVVFIIFFVSNLN